MAESVQETSRTVNEPGVYKHPETGAEVIARRHPKFGNAMADGLARVGFQWDRPAPSKVEEQEAKQRKQGADRVEQTTLEDPKTPEDKKEGKK